MTKRHPRLVICSPVRFGLPAVPSTRGRCQRCQAEVWLSKRAELDAGDDLLCVVCAMSVVQVGDMVSVAPWVSEDLSE